MNNIDDNSRYEASRVHLVIKSLEWGKSHEDTARSCYIDEKMTAHGNSYNYKIMTTGIHVCTSKPWLAVSPDGLVEDPSEQPY